MSKGQHLSGYQQKIVKRYYQNLDAVTLTRLQELVSDLAVAEGEKAVVRLWKRANEALLKAGVEPERVLPIVTARSIENLARLVGTLSAAK